MYSSIVILSAFSVFRDKGTANRTKNQILFAFSLTYSYLCNKNNIERQMTQEEKTLLEERIVDVLKTVYDPEIPVNIYDLGMIYKIDVQDDGSVEMDMTFTAPNCPAADFILEDVRTKVESVSGIQSANVNLVFEPAWDKSMMSEEARVELGFD
jgi:FeS assembly SUF system protein